MQLKKIISLATVLSLGFLLIQTAQAGKKDAAMDPEMEAKMAKAKELGTPGVEHEVLNDLVGNWNVASKFWMKPGEKPQKSTGSSVNAWVLNGRFLRQDYKGDWQGQAFEGIGFIGYDRVKQEYVSVWMDNMSTGMFRGAGQWDAAKKTLEDTGTFSCPVTGDKNMWYRAEWKILNKDKLLHRMYMKDPEGKEFKSMELSYTRAN